MSDLTPVPEPQLQERRERTIALLCEHFARDRLTMEELERRLDLAQRSTSAGELTVLLQDLPVVPETTLPAASRPLPPATRPGNTAIVAVMAGVERRGQWRPAARNFVVAVMGGVDLDFREIALPPGDTEVIVFALMGGVDIVVPPGVAVDATGIAIMGGFDHRSETRRPDPDAPVLRVRGVALMGGVDVSVREPGESAREARQRRKREQKEEREQRRLRGG